MAYSEGVDIPYLNNPGSRGSTALVHRPSIPNDGKPLTEGEVVQGRIFWLPPKEELPDRAVKRAHGKGAVDEGIFNHPVVVLSNPVDEEDVVHFHLITSFQGKRLHEVYGKANEFHASRRSWYLPVSPTPDHPDANSKKAKKRFPTLELHGGAHLRWESYVNLRHIYRVRWSYLRQYTNPETPTPTLYRFERESMIRLLSKSRFLTGYEAGEQRHPSSTKSNRKSTTRRNVRKQPSSRSLSPDSDVPSRGSMESARSPLVESDFLGVDCNPDRIAAQQEDDAHLDEETHTRNASTDDLTEHPPVKSGPIDILMRIITGIIRWVQRVARRLRALLKK